MASGKKTFARRDALRSCTRNSRTRSADQVRQVAASIRVSGFTGPVLFAGGNTVIAGARPCAPARAGGIARPRVSSAQMSGCRWLMTGLTCAGPVRPATPPQARPGTTPWAALPCPPTAGRFHTGTFHTGTGVRQEIAGLHTATGTSLYPGNFSPVFFPEFPEKSGRDRLAAHRPHSQPYCRFCPLRIWSGFMPCYQQVENRCFRQRRFIRADIPSDTPKVSAGVFHHPFRVFRPE